MEGNFRIVQESEYIFVIQKEVVETETKGRWPFRTIHKNISWVDVDKKGRAVFWNTEREFYLSLDQAKAALDNIRKYPVIIDYPDSVSSATEGIYSVSSNELVGVIRKINSNTK